MKKLLTIFPFIALFSCSYMKNNPDNFIEETIEAGIEEVTGFNIDLSSEEE